MGRTKHSHRSTRKSSRLPHLSQNSVQSSRRPIFVLFPLVVSCSVWGMPADEAAWYAAGTPPSTHEAHLRAVARLQAGNPADAASLLAAVPPDERRALTDFLMLVAAARIPAEALRADRYGEAASHPEAPSALLERQADAANRHRAWIAGVQDALADLARERLQLRNRPLPEALEGCEDLAKLRAWVERGQHFHGPTFRMARAVLKELHEDARQPIGALLDALTPQDAARVYEADLTGVPLPPLPAMNLPVL
jgi:hypothetical protein